MTKSASKLNNIIPLKTLCVELKVDPREARQKLRLAAKDAVKYPEIAKAHEPRQQWQWTKNSVAHKEAIKLLSA